jgi:hypothetical protein
LVYACRTDRLCVDIGLYPCVHPCVHANMSACIPAYMSACVRAFMSACVRAYISACIMRTSVCASVYMSVTERGEERGKGDRRRFHEGGIPVFREAALTISCISNHSHDHVCPAGELVHAVLVVPPCTRNRRLRRLQAVQFAVCSVRVRLPQCSTVGSKQKT